MADFFAIVLVGTLLILCLVIMAHMFVNSFRKRANKAEALLMRTLVAEEEPAAKLVNYFAQATGTNLHNATGLSVRFAADKFLTLFKEKYPENLREVVTQFCSMDQKACQTVFKVVGDLGNTIMLSFSWEPVYYLDPKNRPNWVGKNFKLDEQYLYGDENRPQFSYSSGVEIVFPHTIDYTHSDILDLVELIRACEVDRVHYETKRRMTRLFRMDYKMGSYDVVPYGMEIGIQSPEYLDLAYSEVAISFEGETHTLPMSSGMEFAIEALKDGQNLYIMGAPGVGKTTLMEQVQTRLVNQETDINVVNITAGMIDELQTIGAQSDFKDALKSLVAYGGLNVICIDEAESVLTQETEGIHSKANSLLLQLLSGSLQRELNCVSILIFNARPEQLNPAVFRAGRAGVIFDLEALPQAQAVKLVDVLKGAMPEKAFDANKFNKTVSEPSKLPNGMVYATKGMISLADLYSCFMERERRSMLIDLLRKKAGKAPLMETYPKRQKPTLATGEPAPAENKVARPARPPRMVIVPDTSAETVVAKPKPVVKPALKPEPAPQPAPQAATPQPAPQKSKDRRRKKFKGKGR